MTKPTRSQGRFETQKKAEAFELCLQEGRSCNSVTQRLRLTPSRLIRRVRQARYDWGDDSPRDHKIICTSEESAELNRLRKEN